MNSAQGLFEKLTSFKQTDRSASASQQFLEYCTQVLGAVERFHVDFKQKHDRRHSRLENDDKKNLTKAVSGFANSGGGVLIWGIEDKTLKPKPIANVQQFVSSILELAPQVADPTVPNIDGDWILADTQAGHEGFGLVFIPESALPPHRAILNYEGIKNHYFIRSGDSFVVASHTMLEDMFGRRPKPELALSVRIECHASEGNIRYLFVILGIENRGRGTAKSPFLSVNVHKPYKISDLGIDGNRGIGLPRLTKSAGLAEYRYGSSQDIVIHPGIVHDVTAIKVEVDVSRPPSSVFDLVIDYKIAAEGARLVEEQRIVKGREIFAALEQ